MYGLLLENFRLVMLEKYGEPIWNKIVETAGLQSYTFASHKVYSDDIMGRLVQAAFQVTKQSTEEMTEEVGLHFLGFIGQYGYDRILKVLGRHMRDFLNGLDNLHEYLRFTYPKLKAPSFFCEDETEHGLKLYYRSSRKGFLYYVIGQIKAVGRFFYHIDVQVEVLEYTENKEGSKALFQLIFDNSVYMETRRRPKRHSVISLSGDVGNLKIPMDVLYEVFPFHIVFDQDMEISSTGNSLEAVLQDLPGKIISSKFSLIRPFMEFTWQNVLMHTNVVFEVQSTEAVELANTVDTSLKNGETLVNDKESESTGNLCYIHLKGQVLFMKEWNSMVYLATPIIDTLDMLHSLGLYINDLSMHDSSRDLVLAGTQQSAELRLALDQELLKSAKLEESMKALDMEKRRTDSLLYQMIPRSVADRLRQGEPALNTCEMFHDVSVLFSDVVGFTHICSLISPMGVVTMLNNMYTAFDQISEQHNVYKVETIGDAYMVVSGVPERSKYHAEHVADLALDMISAMPTLVDPSKSSPHLKIRIGVHTGMVVAGVVGLKMPRYCLFGDTVNTASRMESTGMAMKIHISETTFNCLQNANYRMKQRGSIEIKGKGGMKTFWLMGKKAAVGEKTVQSFLSFGGGSNPMVINTQNDDTVSNSTLGRIDLHLSGQAIPEEEEEGEQDNDESLNSWPIEENEIINLEKDSPVAYYGHVPHTPLTTNDDFRFQWHKDKLQIHEAEILEETSTPTDEQQNKANRGGRIIQPETPTKTTCTTSTSLCNLM